MAEQIPDTALDKVASHEFFSRGLIRRLVLPMIIAVAVYACLTLYADADALGRSISSIPPSLYAIGLLLTGGNFALRFVRWHLYLLRLDARVRLGQSALVFLAGFAMAVTPGKMGEVIKALLLKESYDIPVARTAPIPIAERVTDVVGLLLLSGLGALVIPACTIVAVTCLFGVVFIIVALTWRRLGERLVGLVARLPKVRRFEPKLRLAHSTLLELSKPRTLALATLLSAVSWGLQCACVPLFSGWFGVELSLFESFLVYSAPLLAGALSLIPGGLGITEASMTGGILSIGGAAATPAVAAAITIITRIASFWFAVVVGFAALFAWQFRRAGKERRLRRPAR